MSNLDNAFKIDLRKAIEAIVYIASRAPVPDIYHVGKIVYFADLHHLESYGRLILGDKYIAMEHGPAPSAVYDLIKDVRDDRKFSRVYRQAKEAFAVSRDGSHRVEALREPNLTLLSESDIESLNASIAENGALSFGRLKEKSHDDAYKKCDLNDDISLESIIDQLPSSESLKEYLSESNLENIQLG